MIRIFKIVIGTEKEFERMKELYFKKGRYSVKAEQQIREAVKNFTNALFGKEAQKKSKRNK